jgi:hypothetical protein
MHPAPAQREWRCPMTDDANDAREIPSPVDLDRGSNLTDREKVYTAAKRNGVGALNRTVQEIHGLDEGFRTEPIWKGGSTTVTRPLPQYELDVARVLRDVMAQTVREAAKRCRADGLSWQQIGELLRLEAQEDVSLAEQAFEEIVGRPDTLYEAVMHWDCGSCDAWVADHGPYGGHPEDNERGHAASCERQRAAVKTYEEWVEGVERDDD